MKLTEDFLKCRVEVSFWPHAEDIKSNNDMLMGLTGSANKRYYLVNKRK